MIELSRQEMFNQVCDHLMTQARKAALEHRPAVGPTCRYRLELVREPGVVLKCAVGCLIPDEMYEDRFEAMGQRWVIRRVLGPDVEEADINFLLGLQQIHDMSTVKEWPGRLAGAARAHKLQLPDSVQKALETPGWPGAGPRGRAGPEPLPGPSEGAR